MRLSQSIMVGQRVIRWDGEPGYITLNSRGVRVFAADEPFLIEWQDGESEYVTLAQFSQEGIRRGKGRMSWAR